VCSLKRKFPAKNVLIDLNQLKDAPAAYGARTAERSWHMGADQSRGALPDGEADVAVAGRQRTRAEPPAQVGPASGENRYRAPIRFQDKPRASLDPGQPQPRLSSDAIATVPSNVATAAPDARLVRLYRRYVITAAIAVIALGALALLGLIAGIPWLASLNPASVTMKANAAICFVLAGVGLFFTIPNGKARPSRVAAVRICAIIVAIIGLATLAEYVLGRDFGIDQLVIAEPAGSAQTLIAGRMAPLTATSFMLFSLALLAHTAIHDHRVSTTLLLAVLLGSILTLTGYILNAKEFYTFAGHFTAVALPTAQAFFLLSSALLVIEPEHGLLRRLASPRSGGVMLRRLLPIALVVPILIVWLRLQGQAMGLFTSIEFGAATVAGANVLVLCCVLFWSAAHLDRSDAARLAAEAHRAAAQYVRSLIEASLDPLVTISAEGRITDVNEATVNVTGVPRERLVSSDFSSYFTDPDKAREGYRKAFATGVVSDYPLSIRSAAGRITDVLYNASLYRDEKGQVAGLFAAARDITERKRAEDELRKYQQGLERIVAERTAALSAANAKLEAANKELEAFSYSVSHDLRTPLRAIDGFSRILLEDYADKLDAEGQRVLNVVRDSTVKMARLIDDILGFSRLGRLVIKAEPVDMVALIRLALTDELAPALVGRDLAIDIGVLPDAHGDRGMLQRVWMNLLDNAIKYTAPKPDARIEIGATAGAGETIYFVRDTGVGFDMQYADKLFGVFQRLHGMEFPGTGIGLAIVKRIVTRHGGRVWAEGKVGEGASFYFALPATGDRS
jgi:PAS domain S-box-containing protein